MEESNLDKEEKEEKLNEKETNKKPIITFSKLNKYYIILFISPIFCMLGNYSATKIKSVIEQKYFYLIISYEVFYIFSGLFYFVSYFRKNSNKGRESNENSNSDKDIKYIYNASFKINAKKVIILLIILSLLLIGKRFLFAYIYENNKIETRFYYMILIPLFSKLILKENLYKHQYLSLAICVIGWIILNIPIFLKLKNQDILANFLNLLIGAIYPFKLVLIKYLSGKYYITPLKIGLILGLISLFLTLIGSLIYSLIKYQDLSFFIAFNFSNADNKVTTVVFFVLFFIFGTILQFLNLLIIFYFSPIFLLISEVISPFLLWIVKAIENKITNKNENATLEIVINPIGYTIVLFSALIYNEIVIFNFCGLNKNTKKYVNERMNKEIKELNELPDYNDTGRDTIEEEL